MVKNNSKKKTEKKDKSVIDKQTVKYLFRVIITENHKCSDVPEPVTIYQGTIMEVYSSNDDNYNGTIYYNDHQFEVIINKSKAKIITND